MRTDHSSQALTARAAGCVSAGSLGPASGTVALGGLECGLRTVSSRSPIPLRRLDRISSATSAGVYLRASVVQLSNRPGTPSFRASTGSLETVGCVAVSFAGRKCGLSLSLSLSLSRDPTRESSESSKVLCASDSLSLSLSRRVQERTHARERSLSLPPRQVPLAGRAAGRRLVRVRTRRRLGVDSRVSSVFAALAE